VRAQREIDAKTNEIPELAPAIACLDLIGTVVTLDALHTQAETAPTWSRTSRPTS
jgi:predicted transposase YbfD/YdcC